MSRSIQQGGSIGNTSDFYSEVSGWNFVSCRLFVVRFVAILIPSKQVLECYLEWGPPTGQFIIYYRTLTIFAVNVPTDIVVNWNKKEVAQNKAIKYISWLILNDPLSHILRKPLDHMRMIVVLYVDIKVHMRTIL